MKTSCLITPESLFEGTKEWCQWSQLMCYDDLRKAAKFTDTVIIVEGRKFPVHSQLLSVSSEYFEHIAFRDFPVAPEIHLADVTSASTFELLLNFVYSGSLPITEENFTELYRDSSFFLMPQALDVCRKWLLSQLDVSSPNEKVLQLAADIILSHGDDEILDSVFTVLAKDLEKYKAIILTLGPQKFHELVRSKNIVLIDDDQLLMGVFYFTKLLQISSTIFPAENTNLKLVDFRNRLTARPSALFISDQRFGSYPQYEETYVHYSAERFVTCNGFPPDEWTISGLTFYELDVWGGSTGLIAGVDVEYRNIWSGEQREFLCNLNTTHGMQYATRKLELEAGETIDSIRLNSGWLIDRIGFTTSRRRRLNYGSSTGGGLREVTRTTSCQRYDDPEHRSLGWGEWQQPTLALHGFAYTLISTLGKITWVDVQFIFSGLDESAARLIDSPKVKLSI
uniref:Kelch-like protein 24 n=2 Tax=Schistocephalus solidus TaxID=70667 RepID=A0A0V0J966_SCHSO